MRVPVRLAFKARVYGNWLFGRGIYEFKKSDVDLFLAERFVKLKSVTTECSNLPGLIKARVGPIDIFWPAQTSPRDLPWLFHEIFDPFSTNPSSYDHPNFNYNDLDWILDGGASEGYFSLFSLEKAACKLLVVEPNSILVDSLKATFAHGIRSGQIHIVAKGLADRESSAILRVHSESVCDAKIYGTDDFDYMVSESPGIIQVELTTIDALTKGFDLAGRGLIKMDIEGFEMCALQGGLETLRIQKPMLAVAVYHDLENARKCAEIIKGCNPEYKIEFRGYYGYWNPPRPYILFAY